MVRRSLRENFKLIKVEKLTNIVMTLVFFDMLKLLIINSYYSGRVNTNRGLTANKNYMLPWQLNLD